MCQARSDTFDQVTISFGESDPRIICCAARKKGTFFCQTVHADRDEARPRAQCNTSLRAKSTSKEAMSVLIKPAVKENLVRFTHLLNSSAEAGRMSSNGLSKAWKNMVMRSEAWPERTVFRQTVSRCPIKRRKLPSYARALHWYCRCNDVTSRQIRAPRGPQPRIGHICPCPLSHASQLPASVFVRRDALGPFGDPQLCFESKQVAHSLQERYQSQ